MDLIEEHSLFIKSVLGKKLEEAKKLNLGCGSDYREGWINADLSEWIKKDVTLDLRNIPLPFEDNSFDYIFSSHTLEHISGSLTPLMIELWRILKPKGVLEIRVPHFSHYSALTGFEHKHVFSINVFNVFMDTSYYKHIPGFPKFQRPLFKKIKGVLKHQRTDNGSIMLVKKNAYYYLADFISKLANLNTNFCEKIWCHWVGGFQEMQIIMQKIPQNIKLEKNYFKKIIS